MMKIRPRRIVAALGVIVLVIGGYVGWQINKGQQMAKQYAANAQKLAQGSGNGSGSANSQTQVSNEITSAVSSGQTPPSGASTSQDPSTPGAQPNSSAPSSPSVAPASEDYKQLMSAQQQVMNGYSHF